MTRPGSALSDTGLVVDGSPYLVFGAELHNSSTSTRDSIDEAWIAVERMGANTVLTPISWAQWEPEEGVHDTSLLDHLLVRAREGGQRLVLLWFGSWKNGVSSYCPTWVKLDPQRFPLAQDASGRAMLALSTFAESNVAADARAFAALLAHLREVDAEHGTVILVQVENEVGLLGTARDHSPLAEAAWASAPPAELFEASRWSDVATTPDGCEERFMAWHYARYVDRVAEAGRREWPVPLYVNAWLDGAEDANPMAGGITPGEYPSGGPVPRMLEIWRAAAPSVDFAAPDTYAGDVADRGQPYADEYGVLLIPEMRRDLPGQIYRAAGHPASIGCAPFGVDSAPPEQLETLRRCYEQLGAVAHRLVGARSADSQHAFHLRADDPDAAQSVTLGDWIFDIEPDFDPEGTGERPDGYGILFRDGNRFLLVGHAIVVRPRHRRTGEPGWVLECQELALEAGDPRPVRILNGDETGGGEYVRITRDDPPGFGPVPIQSSRTGLVSFSLYSRPSA